MNNKSIETQVGRWDLSDLYYGIDDPSITVDFDDALSRAKKFEAQYKGKINSQVITADMLLAALKEFEAIFEKIKKLQSYAELCFAADTNDASIGAFQKATQEKLTEIKKNLIFFELELGTLPDILAEPLLKDELLKNYRHFLESKLVYRPHQLSDVEEKILIEKAQTSSGAFSRLFDEIVNNILYPVKIAKKIRYFTHEETMSFLYGSDAQTREAAAKGLTKGIKKNAHTLTYIMNTLVSDHAIVDRLRGFSHPAASRHLNNKIDKIIIDMLMESVEKNNHLVERYYSLKKKILGFEELKDFDRYAPVKCADADDLKISFGDAEKMIVGAFEQFSLCMAEIAKKFFQNKWIDSAVRVGKRSGAFSHECVPSAHAYILMSYSGRLRDVITLAHELGHGFHQYISRKQNFFDFDAPLILCEAASLFAETIVFNSVMEYEKNSKIKLTLLCRRIEDIISSCFRQVALTRFEEKLHESRRTLGELETKKINELWLEANRPMFGNAVKLTEDYGYWWMYIPHFIHYPFYCYAYAFGELLALSLYQKYLEDGKSFVEPYLEFLSAGGSDWPEKLLMKMGINIKEPAIWQKGIDLFEKTIEEAEMLYERIEH